MPNKPIKATYDPQTHVVVSLQRLVAEYPCVFVPGTVAALELSVIEAFYERVCQRAEANMLKTGRLEGAHFAAMRAEITDMKKRMEGSDAK